jgi:pimeloyl-ACP methyl ester carboxylesterase
MSIPRTHFWRFAFVLAGISMAVGGSNHPEGDAEDSLTGELATMTQDDSWVMAHSFLAGGTALLAIGLWLAHRNRSWPTSTRRALHVVAVTMSLYFVETIFHLASAVDSDALANGDTAPVAFAHVALAIVLYPLSGLTLAWLNSRVVLAATLPMKTFGVVGVVAGLLHAASVPLTLMFPDTEFSQVFASAGILTAVWCLGLGVGGLRGDASDDTQDCSDESEHPNGIGTTSATDPAAAHRYRNAETALWASLGTQPTEREISLPRIGTLVRVQEFGDGDPILYLHGGPSAGTNWAPLAARIDGFRSIIVDRPGSGLSQPYDLTADDLEQFSDRFVIDILDALELDRVHVVASSFGGFLALRAAAVAPQRFDRMVQMACPAGAPGMAVPAFMRAAAIGPMRRLITTLPPSERAAHSILRQIGHGKTVDAGGISPQFMQWYLSLQRDTATMRNDMRLIGSLVSVTGKVHPALALTDELLCRIVVPTLFYWGADDPFGGADVARRTADLIAGAELQLVEDAGHLPWLDDPSQAAHAVTAFLQGDRASGHRSNTDDLAANRVRPAGAPTAR